MLKLQYYVRELAILQAFSRLGHYLRGIEASSLMEIMVGQNHVGPDSWRRDAAAGLLYENVGSMIEMCHDRDVPVMVCSLPGNERDLAPIGTGQPDSPDEDLVNLVRESCENDPILAIGELKALLERQPQHAGAHFYLGKAYFAAGEYEAAHHHFVRGQAAPGSGQKYIEGLQRLLVDFADAETCFTAASEMP